MSQILLILSAVVFVVAVVVGFQVGFGFGGALLQGYQWWSLYWGIQLVGPRWFGTLRTFRLGAWALLVWLCLTLFFFLPVSQLVGAFGGGIYLTLQHWSRLPVRRK